MPRPINNMHRIPISGIENKKCGTVTGVGVNTLSYYRISSKPPLTNYTYESLQRALYPGMTVVEMNDLFDAPQASRMKKLAKQERQKGQGGGSGPLDQNIKCKTVTLNNKVTVPPNKTLYIPKCVILNILQSGTLINNKNKDDKGIVNRGTINNKGKIDNINGEINNRDGNLDNHDGIIDNRNGKIDNYDGLLDNRDGKIENRNGFIYNLYGKLDNRRGKLDNQFGKIENNSDGEIDNTNGIIDNKNGEIINNFRGKINNTNGYIDNRNGKIDNRYGGKIDNTKGIINNRNGKIDNGSTSRQRWWSGSGSEGAGTIIGNRPVGAGTIT